MKDLEFLNWIADRLVNVYGESPNVDFVHKLREIADAPLQKALRNPSDELIERLVRALWGDQWKAMSKPLQDAQIVITRGILAALADEFGVKE